MALNYYTPATTQYTAPSLPDNISRMVQMVEPMRRQMLYNQAQLDTFNEKFGQFTSPLQNDVNDYYSMMRNAGVYQLAQDMSNNPQMLRSPEFAQRFADVKSKIDYNKIAMMQQSRDNALNEQKTYQGYQAKDLYNPNVNHIDYGYSTSQNGIYSGRPTAPWISMNDYLGPLLKTVGPQYVGTKNIGNGYVMMEQNNQQGLNDAITNAMSMADPAMRENWIRDAVSRGINPKDIPAFIQNQANAIKGPYTQYKYEFNKDLSDDGTSGLGKGVSAAGGGSTSSIPNWTHATVGAASSAEQTAQYNKANSPMSDEDSRRANMLFTKDQQLLTPAGGQNYTYAQMGNHLLQTIKTIEDQIGKVKDGDMIPAGVNISGDQPLSTQSMSRKEYLTQRRDAMAAEYNRLTGTVMSGVDPADTEISTQHWNSLTDALGFNPTTGQPGLKAQVGVTYKGPDEKGNTSNQYFKTGISPSEMQFTTSQDKDPRRNNADIVGLLSPGYNTLAQTSPSDATWWNPANVDLQGGPNSPQVSIPARPSTATPAEYAYKDPALKNDLDKMSRQEIGKDNALGNMFFKYISNNALPADGIYTTSHSGIRQAPSGPGGSNELSIPKMSTMIPKDVMISKTVEFGNTIKSKYPAIGDLIVQHPEDFIHMFFGDKNGNVIGDTPGNLTNAVGKRITINEKETASSAQKGVYSPFTKGDYYTLNYRYNMPANKNQEAFEAMNLHALPAATAAGKNLQLLQTIQDVIADPATTLNQKADGIVKNLESTIGILPLDVEERIKQSIKQNNGQPDMDYITSLPQYQAWNPTKKEAISDIQNIGNTNTTQTDQDQE